MRVSRGGWRRPLLVLALGVPVSSALAVGASLVGNAIEDRSTGVVGPWRNLLELSTAGLIIVAIALGMLTVAALVYRRWPLRLMTASPAWRWRLLGFGLMLSLALQALGLALSLGVDPPGGWMPTGWSAMQIGLFGLATLIVVAPFVVAEEVLFRAWLVRPAFRFTTTTVGLFLASGLLFGAFHLKTEPLQLSMHLVSGMAYAWSVVRLGGLEFAIGMHLGRNLLAVLWVDLAGRVMPDEAFNAALVANIIASLMLVAAVELMVRWMPDRLRRRAVNGAGDHQP